MAPGAIYSTPANTNWCNVITKPTKVAARLTTKLKTALFNRNARSPPLRAAYGQGNYIHLANGYAVYDASCGAGVSCIGQYDRRVEVAVVEQMRFGLSYAPTLSYDTQVSSDLATFLITSTDGKLSKCVFYCSGSEAIEASLKIVRQYHAQEKTNPEPSRTLFIARERSYHGATLGALNVSGHTARKETYHDMLSGNVSFVSPCYPYRGRGDKSTVEYVQGLKDELEAEILRLGPQNVAGFIMEPVSGASLGCVPPEYGYLRAMREVCDKYGVLLVFDEVMCGMGRTGTLHAWQKENVVPDVQLVGKGLAGGFGPISGMLLGSKIVNAFEDGPGSGVFNHGHTFQNHPLQCAVALAVQNIIQEDNLVDNAKMMGKLLEEKLRDRIGSHPNVGEIRGRGLFWGIEFVRDKQSKRPFHHNDKVADSIRQQGLCMVGGGIHVYPGSGTADGVDGDHIIISPALNLDEEDVDLIVHRVGRLIDNFFADFQASDE